MPYVRYALTKSIGKKRVFGSETSLDKIMGSLQPSKATSSFESGVKRRKLNIDKLRVRKVKTLKVLRVHAQRKENSHPIVSKQNNNDVDDEYSQSTGLEED